MHLIEQHFRAENCLLFLWLVPVRPAAVPTWCYFVFSIPLPLFQCDLTPVGGRRISRVLGSRGGLFSLEEQQCLLPWWNQTLCTAAGAKNRSHLSPGREPSAVSVSGPLVLCWLCHNKSVKICSTIDTNPRLSHLSLHQTLVNQNNTVSLFTHLLIVNQIWVCLFP